MKGMHEATWRGGPWNGQTISVITGEGYFPIYDNPPAGKVVAESRPQPTLCPVVLQRDGRWIIDWDHRINPHSDPRPKRP